MYSGGAQPSWFDSGIQIPVHRELGSSSSSAHDQANIVELDKYEDLVWVGTQRGRLMSYLVDFPAVTDETNIGHFQPYSRFNVDATTNGGGYGEDRVIQLLTQIEGVVSLTKNNVYFNSRGGVSHQMLSAKAVGRMTSNNSTLSSFDVFPHNPSQLVIGSDSGSKTLFYADSIKGELTTFFDLPHSVSKVHCSLDNLLVVGGTNGQLSFVEGRLPSRITQTVTAHPYEVTSIASSFNYIFTCGKRDGSRGSGFSGVNASAPQILAPDVFLKVFDIRNLKHAIPVSFPSGAVKVNVNIGSNSVGAGGVNLLVLSNFGLWQQGELYANNTQLRNCEYFKTDCYPPMHSPDLPTSVVDWSVSCDLNAMLDTAGIVHLWIRSEAPFPPRVATMNSGGASNLLMPPSRSPVMPSFPNILHPLNAHSVFDTLTKTRVYSDTVRDGSWLSTWAHSEILGMEMETISTPIRPQVPILPVIAANSKEWTKDSFLKYCTNTGGLKYNSLVWQSMSMSGKKANSLSPFRANRPPRFSANRTSELELEYASLDLEDDVAIESGEEGTAGDNATSLIPSKRWRFTPVDYSINHSLFPFNLYNRASSSRCGLENGQGALDALNSLIQVVYYFQNGNTRSILKSHLCGSEICVVCELGFLFHMMDEARFSRTMKLCQPVRFSRAVKKMFSYKFGVGNHLLPETVVELFCDILAEIGKFFPATAGLEKVAVIRPVSVLASESGDVTDDEWVFSETFASPDSLVVDYSSCEVVSNSAAALVPRYITVNHKTGQVVGKSNSQCVIKSSEEVTQYALESLVVHVYPLQPIMNRSTSQQTPKGGNVKWHYSTIVNVPDDLNTLTAATISVSSRKPGGTISGVVSAASSEDEEAGGSSSVRFATPAEELVSPVSSEWILFNDFVVTNSSVGEATDFRNHKWRKPVFGVYTAMKPRTSSSMIRPHATSLEGPITVDVFRKDENLSGRRKPREKQFVPLSDTEIEELVRGELVVALDTEFISIGLGAIEIREDGSREVGKPGDMAVGRVSVLRVKNDPSDPLDGVPIFDHYISMDESEIKDYVTRFSGIRPGDLDVNKSEHWLVSGKSIYEKLRFLVDSGTKFIGHGLHTDFRIINLWVPTSSLIDTVQLFHMPGQRFLSLKFLAKNLLQKSIQGGNVHCSVEDARAATELWRVYEKLKAEGSLDTTIKNLYETGRMQGWK